MQWSRRARPRQHAAPERDTATAGEDRSLARLQEQSLWNALGKKHWRLSEQRRLSSQAGGPRAAGAGRQSRVASSHHAHMHGWRGTGPQRPMPGHLPLMCLPAQHARLAAAQAPGLPSGERRMQRCCSRERLCHRCRCCCSPPPPPWLSPRIDQGMPSQPAAGRQSRRQRQPQGLGRTEERPPRSPQGSPPQVPARGRSAGCPEGGLPRRPQQCMRKQPCSRMRAGQPHLGS